MHSKAMALAVSAFALSGSGALAAAFNITDMDLGDPIVAAGPVIDGDPVASISFQNQTDTEIVISGTVSASANTEDALEALRYGFSLTENDESVDNALVKPFSENVGGGFSSDGVTNSLRAGVGETFFLVFRDSFDLADDQIVSTFTATPAPIPLPAAAWLLIGGLASLGALKRRDAKGASVA
jgi:hypothetical protein